MASSTDLICSRIFEVYAFPASVCGELARSPVMNVCCGMGPYEPDPCGGVWITGPLGVVEGCITLALLVSCTALEMSTGVAVAISTTDGALANAAMRSNGDVLALLELVPEPWLVIEP